VRTTLRTASTSTTVPRRNCARLAYQRLQAEALHLRDTKRLRDGKRAIREVSLGRDDVDRDAVLGERPQRERRFQTGHPTARDEHAKRAATTPWHRVSLRFVATETLRRS
jgi:hypothetical protein